MLQDLKHTRISGGQLNGRDARWRKTGKSLSFFNWKQKLSSSREMVYNKMVLFFFIIFHSVSPLFFWGGGFLFIYSRHGRRGRSYRCVSVVIWVDKCSQEAPNKTKNFFCSCCKWGSVVSFYSDEWERATLRRVVSFFSIAKSFICRVKKKQKENKKLYGKSKRRRRSFH